jgi:Mg2+ and Co2+ transporter CorA
MNIGLPGGGDPPDGTSVSFWVIMGIMLGMIVGMAAYFRRRGWL